MIKKMRYHVLDICLIVCLCASLTFGEETVKQTPINIGSRLELFVDDFLIDHMDAGAKLVLHRPERREVVMVTDKPWEGNACHYRTVFQDGDQYKMYYTALHYKTHPGDKNPPEGSCFAWSKDGINWVRPELDLFEFEGSKKNNLIFAGRSLGGVPITAHNFVSVFKDTNPKCLPEQRYKAIVVAPRAKGLYTVASPDGLNWKMLSSELAITKGKFDSQNLAFYDTLGNEYRAYFRDNLKGLRGIRTATSKDFIHWSDPVWLKYTEDRPDALYTNQIIPYYRAPHIFVGFPMRYEHRGWSEPMKKLPGLKERQRRSAIRERYGTAITDALFMSSRDGLHFHRWSEAFIRPGLRSKENWVYGDNSIAWGILETKSDMPDAPNELSFYATDGYWVGDSLNVRRYTLRMDGFVSIQAPMTGGECITKPIVFDGSRLFLNMSTSAAGSIQIEIQDESGQPIPGFALKDCPETFGDAIDYPFVWSNNPDLGKLAGKPVRLRFVLKDADIYAFQFK